MRRFRGRNGPLTKNSFLTMTSAAALIAASVTMAAPALADDATAIGFSWHHAIGDMQTLMLFMNAWAAAAADKPTPLKRITAVVDRFDFKSGSTEIFIQEIAQRNIIIDEQDTFHLFSS